MKKIRFLFGAVLSIVLAINVFSQAITTNPLKATDDIAVDVIVDISKCSRQDLLNTAEDVYIHIGVNIDKFAGQWSYVKTDWGTTDEEFKMTKISNNVYKFSVTPGGRDYFGVKQDERIYSIAVVARNGGGTKQTEDLFVTIFESGLNVEILSPSQDTIIEKGNNISVTASSFALGSSIPEADSLKLYLADSLVYKVEATSLAYTFPVNKAGSYLLKVEAFNTHTLVKDSVTVFSHNTVNVEDVPVGLEDGINYIDDNTVSLVLYAPLKSLVFAIGDFNDWELQDEYQMNKSTEGKRWWITISGLTKGKEYGFQYLIDGNIRVADPYTEKVLDPLNDKYIPSSTYPNLKPYPQDKTEGIVGIIQTGVTPYTWQTIDFQAPAVEDLVIYEMHVQNFTEAGNIKTVTDTLDYLERLGINAIELMPVNEFEGNQSWGYNPSFYFAFDKIYGTKDDFKEFVDACHEKGIAVIMDMVYNHSFSQCSLVQMYWNGSGVTSDNPWYNTSAPHTCFNWGFDFNHESEATKYFIDRANRYWLEEYNIDGFRFDFTKGFTNTATNGDNGCGSNYDASRISILKRLTDSIKKVKEDAYVIFEHLATNSEETELANYGILLWGNMNNSFGEGTTGDIEDNKSDLSWISYEKRGWDAPHVVGYMESHDEERLMYNNYSWGKSGKDYDTKDKNIALARMELAAAFFFTVPGPKMIWEFGEVGYDFSINTCTDGSTNDDCRLALKPIRWDYYQDPYRYRCYKVFELLIKLKTNFGITKTTDFNLNLEKAGKVIHLNSADTNVTVIGNFNVYNIGIIPGFQHTGTWYDYLTGNTIEVTNTEEMILLAPGEYHVYIDQDIVVSEYPTSDVQHITKPGLNFVLYPNPYSIGGDLTLEFLSMSEEFFTFYIYNYIGQQVYSAELNLETEGTIHISVPQNINKGVYIYKVITKESEYSGKLIIQ